jgi:hypothetical protein
MTKAYYLLLVSCSQPLPFLTFGLRDHLVARLRVLDSSNTPDHTHTDTPAYLKAHLSDFLF